MPLLYHAYVYLEFLILACTIYILAPDAVDIDLKLKQMAQTYFEEHYGTRKKFREVFGKSWL